MDRQTRDPVELRAELIEALRAAGISWADLTQRTAQLVVFGSRATGEAGPESDWDVLAVGTCSRQKTKAIDLVCVSDAAVKSDDWLGSELANHIAKFGVWVHGVDTWSAQVFVSAESIESKKKAIQGDWKDLSEHADVLAPQFVRRRLSKLRRDLQRLGRMMRGVAVPTTAVLDQEWFQCLDPVMEFKVHLTLAGIDDRCSGQLIAQLPSEDCAVVRQSNGDAKR